MSRLLSWLLLGCTILTACQAPVPNNPLTSIPTPAPVTPEFPVSSGAWQVWPAASHPQEVNALVRDQEVLWIGNAFGVVQFDLKTRTVMRFDPIGRLENLLPTGQGQAFAATQHGLFFFDGASWTRVSLSTTPPYDPSFVGGMGLDLNGDLWIWVTSGRNSLSYHFLGHVPPSNAPWRNIEGDISRGPYQGNLCQEWHTLSEADFTFSSPEGCQAAR